MDGRRLARAGEHGAGDRRAASQNFGSLAASPLLLARGSLAVSVMRERKEAGGYKAWSFSTSWWLQPVLKTL
jgi:hypothetical protein